MANNVTETGAQVPNSTLDEIGRFIVGGTINEIGELIFPSFVTPQPPGPAVDRSFYKIRSMRALDSIARIN